MRIITHLISREVIARLEVSTPSRLEDILADRENDGVVAILVVAAPESPPRFKRVNITIPEDTLRRIDAW